MKNDQPTFAFNNVINATVATRHRSIANRQDIKETGQSKHRAGLDKFPCLPGDRSVSCLYRIIEHTGVYIAVFGKHIVILISGRNQNRRALA